MHILGKQSWIRLSGPPPLINDTGTIDSLREAAQKQGLKSR